MKPERIEEIARKHVAARLALTQANVDVLMAAISEAVAETAAADLKVCDAAILLARFEAEQALIERDKARMDYLVAHTAITREGIDKAMADAQLDAIRNGPTN